MAASGAAMRAVVGPENLFVSLEVAWAWQEGE
jgi:hypothetical protein